MVLGAMKEIHNVHFGWNHTHRTLEFLETSPGLGPFTGLKQGGFSNDPLQIWRIMFGERWYYTRLAYYI